MSHSLTLSFAEAIRAGGQRLEPLITSGADGVPGGWIVAACISFQVLPGCRYPNLARVPRLLTIMEAAFHKDPPRWLIVILIVGGTHHFVQRRDHNYVELAGLVVKPGY